MEYEVDEKSARIYCEGIVAVICGETVALAWWDSPNLEFGMLTPNQAWSQNWSMVYAYCVGSLSGDYS